MIEGHVKGNVYATDDNAQARVLESGRIEGEIRVPSLIINGHVAGDVFSSKHIELASKAVISGNVHYVLIEMVKGAQVNGKLVYDMPKKGSKTVESKPIPQPAASKAATMTTPSARKA